MKVTIAACLAVVALVVGMFVYKMLQPLTDAQLRDLGYVTLPAPRGLDTFDLVDHQRRSFNPDTLKGKWTFVYFGFTYCPDVCPVTMAALAQVERTLRTRSDVSAFERFQGVLVSVDPERDSPEVLRDYVGAFSERFIGVTGDVAAVASFAKQLYASFAKVPAPNSAVEYLVEHSSNIVVINPSGAMHGFVKPPFDPEAIARGYVALATAN